MSREASAHAGYPVSKSARQPPMAAAETAYMGGRKEPQRKTKVSPKCTYPLTVGMRGRNAVATKINAAKTADVHRRRKEVREGVTGKPSFFNHLL